MRVERLNGVQIPNVFFEVKDDFMYYASDRGIHQLNLLNGEKRVFKLENLPDQAINSTQFINDKICFCYCSGASQEWFYSELEFNSKKRTVKCLDHVRLDCEEFGTTYYRSRDVVANLDYSKFICLKNNHLYNISGLTTENPVFAKEDRMYYITKQHSFIWCGQKLILHSFKLDDENQKEEQKLNVECPLADFGGGAIDSLVFGHSVYFIRYAYGITKMFQLDLSTLSLCELPVDGLSDLNLWWGWANNDEKSIYLTDFHVTTEQMAICKIKVDEDESNDLNCPRCHQPYSIQKFLVGCDHSICGDCVKDMLKQFADTVGRQLNCPVSGCTNVVTLRKGETLPTNSSNCSTLQQNNIQTSEVSDAITSCPVCFDNFDVPKVFPYCGHSICSKCEARMYDSISRTISCPTCVRSVRLEPGQSLPVNYTLKDIIEHMAAVNKDNKIGCTSCRKQVQISDALSCGQCQVIICALCAFKNHRHHANVDAVPFATISDKEAVIQKHLTRPDDADELKTTETLLVSGIERKCGERMKKIQAHHKLLQDLAIELRSNPLLTSEELRVKDAELKVIADMVDQPYW